ncbi:hypothetical protein SARC_07949, partial [Sphaeroforma arctica JP610]
RLLNELANLGHHTIPEASRLYTDEIRRQGSTIQQVRADEGAFQNTIIALKHTLETQMLATTVSSPLPDARVFLDRGLPDSVTYYRFTQLDPNEALQHCFARRYSHVFILDPLPLELDGTRVEDEQRALAIDQWLERDYTLMGYTVVRVPVVPVQERLQMVLQYVSTIG